MAKAEQHMEELARHQVIWQEQEGTYELRINRQGLSGASVSRLTQRSGLVGSSGFPPFAFTGGTETRKRGGVYWIAYRHVKGKRRSQYIGTPATVTIARLEACANELERLTIPEADA